MAEAGISHGDSRLEDWQFRLVISIIFVRYDCVVFRLADLEGA